MAKFRMNDNKFPINVDRYQAVSKEDRICTKCVDKAGEDEFHALFLMYGCVHCYVTDVVCTKYLQLFYKLANTMQILRLIYASTNSGMMRKLSLFSRIFR